MTDLSAADVGALMMANGGRSGMTGAGAGALGGIGGFLGGILLGGILGGNWFGNRGGFNNAIGYENLATSNEVQRGFDNQNSMANQREILSAVNQNFHDTLTVLQDKYGELARDIAAVQVSQANALANQNQCCCDTKLLITEQSALTNANIAQSRYDAAMNTSALQATIVAENQKTRDMFTQNKIESLQNQINQLSLANQMLGVVKYPMSTAYTSGGNPFCNCSGCGCGF